MGGGAVRVELGGYFKQATGEGPSEAGQGAVSRQGFVSVSLFLNMKK